MISQLSSTPPRSTPIPASTPPPAADPQESFHASGPLPVEQPMKVMPLANGSYLVRFIAPHPGVPLHGPLGQLSNWVLQNHFPGGVFNGLGSATNLTLATWDAGKGGYTTTQFEDPSYEATGIQGNVAYDAKDQVSIHMHMVIGDKNKNAHMGHVVGDFDVPAVLELQFTPSLDKLHRGVSAGTNGPALEP